MGDPARFWDRLAERYSKQPVKDPDAYETTLTRARAHLGEGHRVLEIGCGTGTTALKLADTGAEILATDISPKMIEIAAEKGRAANARNVTFQVGQLGDGGLSQGGFDAVMAFNLLHLLPDIAGAVGQVRELLKPGGLFISKTVCLGGAGWYYRPLIGVMRAVGYAPHVSFVSPEEIEALIETGGFEILDRGSFPAKPPSRFVVARKV